MIWAACAVIEERVVWESLRWADARLGVEPVVGRECRQHEMSAAEWHASLYGQASLYGHASL